MFRVITIAFFICAVSVLLPPRPAWAEMRDYPRVQLQSLDKITARTMTFEAQVGNTIKFGPLFIKIRACRKADPMDQPESAAFLQIWETAAAQEGPDEKAGSLASESKAQDGKDKDARWVFSGWMFASSPALSPMDHPVYDVWVLDCLGAPVETEPPPAPDQEGDSGNDIQKSEGPADKSAP